MVELLIEHGADIHAADRWGRTPLTRAIFRLNGGHPTALRLLELGADTGSADPQAADNQGKTPLDLLETLPLETPDARGGVRDHQGVVETIQQAIR